jgi:hypothetical protein
MTNLHTVALGTEDRQQSDGIEAAVLLKDPVRVWVRPLGNGWRVRVESVENATWLIDRLKETHELIGLEYVEMRSTEAGCMFEIPNSSRRTRLTLESALAQIPGVRLMLEPESV